MPRMQTNCVRDSSRLSAPNIYNFLTLKCFENLGVTTNPDHEHLIRSLSRTDEHTGDRTVTNG